MNMDRRSFVALMAGTTGAASLAALAGCDSGSPSGDGTDAPAADATLAPRALGRSGVQLSTLGFGAAPIGKLYAEVDDAVALAGIADTGPMLPMLSGLSPSERERVGPAARELRAWDERLVAEPA